jgi:predicted nucleotidyltransferase
LKWRESKKRLQVQLLKLKKNIRYFFTPFVNTLEITVVYAAEGGSRSWGWASLDSDFDIRFIYAQSMHWYFSIEEGKKEVLEIPHTTNSSVDAEYHGWELKKALKMLRESNPGLIEWMR